MAKSKANKKEVHTSPVGGMLVIKIGHKPLVPSDNESANEQENDIPTDAQGQHEIDTVDEEQNESPEEQVQEDKTGGEEKESHDEFGQEYGLSEDEVRNEVKPIYDMLISEGHDKQSAAEISCEIWSDKHSQDHERMSEDEMKLILPEAFEKASVGKAQSTQTEY